MTPAQLDIAIRRTIVTQRERAVEVIARRTAAPPENKLETALGGIPVALVMLRTMSMTDRVSWILWSWGLCMVSLRMTHRNRSRLRERMKSPQRKRIPVERAA
jgi:uncharacterized membrane protein YecN with MAPEG domain